VHTDGEARLHTRGVGGVIVDPRRGGRLSFVNRIRRHTMLCARLQDTTAASPQLYCITFAVVCEISPPPPPREGFAGNVRVVRGGLRWEAGLRA
jgi:hypothetical protein